MTPIYFGTGPRRLFGLYEVARTGKAHRAVVLCQPWGQEYLRAHRSIRRLANMLVATGWDTLRFDYFGTGDSAGDMTEADIAGWESDIESAIEEARDSSGVTRVALIGLRLGGSLAARVAARRKDVDALVMWDPVVRGQDFLDDVRALETAVLSAPPSVRDDANGGGHEILGFPLTSSMAAQIRSIDLPGVADALPNRTLTLVSRTTGSHGDLIAALARQPTHPLAVELISSLPAWLEDRHTGAGAMPVNALQRVTEWLA